MSRPTDADAYLTPVPIVVMLWSDQGVRDFVQYSIADNLLISRFGDCAGQCNLFVCEVGGSCPALGTIKGKRPVGQAVSRHQIVC